MVDQANQLIGEGHLTLGPAEEGIAGGLLLRRGRVDINVPFPCFCSDGGNRSVPKWQRFSFPRRAGVNDG